MVRFRKEILLLTVRYGRIMWVNEMSSRVNSALELKLLMLVGQFIYWMICVHLWHRPDLAYPEKEVIVICNVLLTLEMQLKEHFSVVKLILRELIIEKTLSDKGMIPVIPWKKKLDFYILLQVYRCYLLQYVLCKNLELWLLQE